MPRGATAVDVDLEVRLQNQGGVLSGSFPCPWGSLQGQDEGKGVQNQLPAEAGAVPLLSTNSQNALGCPASSRGGTGSSLWVTVPKPVGRDQQQMWTVVWAAADQLGGPGESPTCFGLCFLW